jgi:hypothetical protein
VSQSDLNSAYTDDQMIDGLTDEQRQEIMEKTANVDLIGENEMNNPSRGLMKHNSLLVVDENLVEHVLDFEALGCSCGWSSVTGVHFYQKWLEHTGAKSLSNEAAEIVKRNMPCAKCGEVHDNPENVYHAGPVGFEADFDRIMVLEDAFRSGYECDTCKETGKLSCKSCANGRSRLNPEIVCKDCDGSLYVKCSDCGGKGVLLEIPQSAQRRPTTGKVVSVGESVKKRKRGHRVMYPSFCGEVMDLKGVDSEGRELAIVVRFIAEKETIARMSGTMELRRVSKQQFNVGG